MGEQIVSRSLLLRAWGATKAYATRDAGLRATAPAMAGCYLEAAAGDLRVAMAMVPIDDGFWLEVRRLLASVRSEEAA